ncbi:MAG: hypothetical protein V4660_05415 [Pseudomonadota bacterium]
MTRYLQKYFHSPFDNFSPAEGRKESTCSDSLAFTLSLTIEGESHQVPGANIKQCELRAFSYGFDCVLGFYLPNDQRKDDLFTAFTSESLITVELGITGVINMPKPPPKIFKVTGLVKDKSLSELAYRQITGNPVLYRYYQIEFADPAQVLWQQHYPCELYVKDSMSSVINAQVVSPIALTIDFAAADQVQPLICLALGNAEKNSPGETGVSNHASFYDFLMDYCDKINAFFVYDYAKQNYCLKGDSPDLETGTAFLPHEISDFKIYWPAQKRSTTNLLNGIAEGSKQSAIENKNAVAGIKQDIVLRQAIESQFSERNTRETNKVSILGEQLDVHFSQWPMQTFWPNCELSFNSTVDGKKYFYTDKSYRSYAFFISAKAKDNTPEQDLDLPFTQYELQYQVLAHNSTIEQPILPLYQKPFYPLYIEGVIVSEQGNDDEKTFDVVSNTETGQFEYKVHIPLWDKTIQIMLEPDFINSHFYFPFFRGVKLLLSLELHRAHIQKVLSWGEGVQLPLATQGNHILFGKKMGDETSLSHVYEDSKPVFAIKRSKDKDTELMRMEEGTIIFQTCEEE